MENLSGNPMGQQYDPNALPLPPPPNTPTTPQPSTEQPQPSTTPPTTPPLGTATPPDEVTLEEVNPLELSDEEKKQSLTKVIATKLCNAYNSTLPAGQKPLDPTIPEFPPGYNISYNFKKDEKGQIQFERLRAKNGEDYLKTTITVTLNVKDANGKIIPVSFEYPAAAGIRFPSPNASIREQEAAFRKGHMAILLFAEGTQQALAKSGSKDTIAKLFNNATSQIQFKYEKDNLSNYYGRVKRLSVKEKFRASLYPWHRPICGGRLNGVKVDLSKGNIQIRASLWPQQFTSQATTDRNNFRNAINTHILERQAPNTSNNNNQTTLTIPQIQEQLQNPNLPTDVKTNLLEQLHIARENLRKEISGNPYMNLSELVEANLKDADDLTQDLDADLPKGLLENALDHQIAVRHEEFTMIGPRASIHYQTVGKLINDIDHDEKHIIKLKKELSELEATQSEAAAGSTNDIGEFGANDAITKKKEAITIFERGLAKEKTLLQTMISKLDNNAQQLEKLRDSTECMLSLFKGNAALGGPTKEDEYSKKLEELNTKYKPLIEKRKAYFDDEILNNPKFKKYFPQPEPTPIPQPTPQPAPIPNPPSSQVQFTPNLPPQPLMDPSYFQPPPDIDATNLPLPPPFSNEQAGIPSFTGPNLPVPLPMQPPVPNVHLQEVAANSTPISNDEIIKFFSDPNTKGHKLSDEFVNKMNIWCEQHGFVTQADTSMTFEEFKVELVEDLLVKLNTNQQMDNASLEMLKFLASQFTSIPGECKISKENVIKYFSHIEELSLGRVTGLAADASFKDFLSGLKNLRTVNIVDAQNFTYQAILSIKEKHNKTIEPEGSYELIKHKVNEDKTLENYIIDLKKTSVFFKL